MTIIRTICFGAVALMICVSGNAQSCNSCGNAGGEYPTDTHCARPWNYQDANALWSNYCHQPIREQSDFCLKDLFKRRGNCAPAQCSKWPSQCGTGCGHQAGCGLLAGLFGCNSNECHTSSCFRWGAQGCGIGCGVGHGCGGGCGTGCNIGAHLGIGTGAGFGFLTANSQCGCGVLGNVSLPSAGFGCGSGCGVRHGFDLFAGLKANGCGCGLGVGLGACGNGCGGGGMYGNAYAQPGCGCN